MNLTEKPRPADRRSFRRIWPMLELRVPPRLFPSRLPTLRLWSPWLLPSGVRTLRLCACEFWWRFRSRHGRGLPRRRRAPLDWLGHTLTSPLALARLAEILRQGLEDVAAFAIYDPEAVQQAIAAGIGAKVSLSAGGKIAMPAIPVESPPLTVTATVKTISNGQYRNRGPMARGLQMDMGPTVVLDTGAVEVVLISRHVEPSDLNCLLCLGIDPLQKRYVMLKSRVHWRAGLGPMAKAVVDCAGVGVCTSDYSQLQFEKVRRPIYPLDLPNR
jgi:MlrC C-terminus